MMPWLILAVLVGGSLLALRFVGVSGGLWTASAAALMLGATGYAVQGDPSVPAAPGLGGKAEKVLPLTAARHEFFGDFSSGESWMRMSEALASSGNKADAVGILSNAVGRHPGDAQLWVGLGNALVDQAQMITPPAEYAYQRAAEVAPGNPAGPFFYGLALARSGDPQAAVAIWQSILATAPKEASWRPLIEQGVAALSQPQPARPAAPKP
ncbi:MAG: cytochrome C biosynthesis protein [Sphingomonas sp.]|nr:cytochrome C biosynthesis protein [Sphingomonas sp.]